MRRVILESPFASPHRGLLGCVGRWRNRRYARRALRHSLLLGESPLASHLLYTQPGVLRDDDPVERRWGIEAGLSWLPMAMGTVVYCDLGISEGMQKGIDRARAQGIHVDLRWINPTKKAVHDLYVAHRFEENAKTFF